MAKLEIRDVRFADLEQRALRNVLLGNGWNMNSASKLLAIILLALAPVAKAQEAETPSVNVDPDGTVHWGPRSIPPAMAASPEARQLYIEDMARNLSVGGKPPTQDVTLATSSPQNPAARREARALEAARLYPVDIEQSEIGGIPVSIYSGKEIAPRNRHRVAMEFEIDPEAVMLASIGKMRIISVHYSGPLGQQSRQIVAVYRELLKSYKPAEIAMYGISGGVPACREHDLVAATTKLAIAWCPRPDDMRRWAL